jgi:hypothetical protein
VISLHKFADSLQRKLGELIAGKLPSDSKPNENCVVAE